MLERPSQASDKKEADGAGAAFRAPSITLPKGGGAIRGIGEKFAANPVTGTGSMSVPLATSPGRSGFGPQLSLSYDSGAGNGPFGFGWSLSLPSITRKTDKGLPQYFDREESDVFILSGAEDLVPELRPDGSRFEDTAADPAFTIHRYRPRIEGLFARIERWTRRADGDIHWRSISKDNILTLYGKDDNSRIVDPTDPTHVFSWLICETRDDKGNGVVYEYKSEDGTQVGLSRVHERNRGDRNSPLRTANRYIKRIRYGNRNSLLTVDGLRPRLLSQAALQNASWMFEVVFDYGEHDRDEPRPNDPGEWLCRHDPFSIYRAGFEVRTYRLCQRVLMFHHFPDEPDVRADCLVRSTDFVYRDIRNNPDDRTHGHPIASFIVSVTQNGYRRTAPDGYLKKSLPPVEFEYSEAVICQEIHDVDAASIENLPYGADGSAYQWVDLDGEGLSGVLTEQGGGWFYKRNESPITREGDTENYAARFAPIETVSKLPPGSPLGAGGMQFLDLAGDGQVDLVDLDQPVPGFYERTDDEDWEDFRTFRAIPNLTWNDPSLKFIDLTGDGHADVLIAEDHVFTWYPSLAEEGFGEAKRSSVVTDEERGPKVVFADPTQTIHLADLSGDGLTDIVRIRNGEVCYWPNLGYGRFGAKVTMDDGPWFDTPDQFDPRRIRLADIDGSGVTDIIYLGPRQSRFWFNQSGNAWSAPNDLSCFAPIDNVASVAAVDLLGNGTACLVWSSPLPGATRAPMKYLNLMAEGKPHLLVRTINNLGAETRVRYAPSTYFYLRDKYDDNPWITKLPFPVHVVDRVETFDRIGRNRFVTSYAYHHGYFDGVEREFRGFGMVEQWDTEEFAALDANIPLAPGDGGEGGGEGATVSNIDAASHVPPVHTKTWFHTGIYLGRAHVSDFFAGLLDVHHRGEYYREPGLLDPEARGLLLDDTVLPEGLTVEEEREACRALKGSMLRQEVYALDGTAQAQHPYTVAEQNFTVEVLQHRGANRYAVFFTHAREAISYHYERNPTGPRIAHALTLEVDAFGNVLKQAAIAYARRQPDMALLPEDRAKQTQVLITYTENQVTNATKGVDDYRTPLPSETRTFELTGVPAPAELGRYTLVEILTAGTGAATIGYEANATSGALQRRLIEHVRTCYRPNDLGAAQNDALSLLPLGVAESLALPGESYKLAFTPSLITHVYGDRVTDAMLEDEGRYVHSEGDPNWWIPSGRVFLSPGTNDTPQAELLYARQHFFLPHRFRDPFHIDALSTESFVSYDGYDLLMLETRDALDNRVTAGERDANGNLVTPAIDYRVLQPRLMTDPNRNRAAVTYDALGMVVGTAVMGKPPPAPVEGDSLEGFEPDLTDETVLTHLEAPFIEPHAIVQRATTRLVYDPFAFFRTRELADPQPAAVYTLARETHDADLAPGAQTRIQHSFSYSDGFGREIQKKIQAEPGPVPQRDENGEIIVGADGQPAMAPNDVSPRWVGSGWTVFNNKGKPVRQYEPYFTDTHRFEFNVRIGVSPVIFYDPLQRVVATLHPNHTWEKVAFDAWRQETWDVNDTVLIGDPADDADVGDFFRRLPTTDYLPTWHAQRIGGELGSRERSAAEKTAVHADTPTVAHFDTLGRPFLTIAHNLFERDGLLVDESYPTRVELDIEGNQRAVRDAIVQAGDPLGRIVMRYDYDILGNRVHQASMEAGERWMLNDVAGTPILSWNSRDHVFRFQYDALRRPVHSFVQGSDPENPAGEILFGRTVYGEDQDDVIARNLRTRVFQVFDTAGIVTSDPYDFKGNLLRGTRQLVSGYRTSPDWSGNPALDPDVFTSSTTYDALNRPVTLITPDNSVVHPSYNEANLLEQVEAILRGSATVTELIRDIDYNSKGQRELIEYGNGASTTYEYDRLTFRLIRLQTLRGGDPLQDLSYVYDPSGNITDIHDDAQQTIYFNNTVVEPHADYTYDAIYRLIAATGREHIGQASQPQPSWNDEFRIHLAHPHDGQAMREYMEEYQYDVVGNFQQLIHQATNGNWTRNYAYEEASLIEPAKQSNRLSRTSVGATDEHYAHDNHGNMTSMPHLPMMRWDFQDQLQAIARQVVNEGTPETTYYVYDAAGQRVRKVTERQAGPGAAPTRMDGRIYLGGFEVYREYQVDGTTVALERETLHIMDDQQRVALVETRTQGNDGSLAQLIRYQLGNRLGSACLELDAEAAVISYEEYHPYGSTAYQAGRSVAEVSLKRYRYTGKERDEETGLNYHGARYYAIWLGRWTAADPIGIGDGVNLYAYVSGSPVRNIDPLGTDKWDTAIGALLAEQGELAIGIAHASTEAEREHLTAELTRSVEETVEAVHDARFQAAMEIMSSGSRRSTDIVWEFEGKERSRLIDAYLEANPSPQNTNQKYLVPGGRQLTAAQMEREAQQAEYSALVAGPLSAFVFGLTGDVNAAGLAGGLEQMGGAFAAPRSATGRSVTRSSRTSQPTNTDAPVTTKNLLPSLWKLNPFQRGRRIESDLGAQKDMRANRPGIDKAVGNTITSIKSIDLNSPSVSTGNALYVRLMRYANRLATFGKYGVNTYKPATRALVSTNPRRVLEVAIPWTAPTPSQTRMMNEAARAAATIGISITFRRVE